MEIELIERELLDNLPQTEYVMDQVGAAMNWIKEVKDEGSYYKTLKFAIDVAKYALEVSEKGLFKTRLVIAALLMDLKGYKEDERFKRFDSASKSVEEAISKITVPEELSEKKGCFKAVIMTLAPLANEDENLFAVMLLSILHDIQEVLEGMKEVDVKTPITSSDYIMVLGYATVIANLKFSDLHLLNSTRRILNDIDILLNTKLNY